MPVERERGRYVIVVPWFLQCMGYVPREGCTIPCTDRPYKATARLASAPEYSTYCTLAVQRKVPHARRCSYSSIA